MDIGMLLTKPFPFDIRVRKEAKTLLEAGHDVTVLCRREEGEQAAETVNGIQVYRHSPERGSQEWRNKITYVATQTHPSWAAALRKLIIEEPIDVLHIHDLRFVDTALSVSEQFDLPVIADLHENYPEAVRQWRKMVKWKDIIRDPMKLGDRLAFPVARYKRNEQRCMRKTEKVITVAKEAKEHYVQDCGATPEDVCIVSNRADLDRLDKMDVEPIDHDGFLITYVGSFGPHRGLETAIKAMPDIVDTIPEAQLLIVGAAGEENYEQELQALCESEGVADSVTFTGWVDFERVPSYIAGSDICVVLHAETAHTETTIPHKLFQYMAYQRPLIVTDVGPLERVVRATNAGIVIPTGNDDAMANAVQKLYHNPTQRETLGENGREAVESEYNWDNEAETLRRVYRDLTESERS